MARDQTTIPGSSADYWINHARTGVWRVARRTQPCDHTNTKTPCPRGIKAGERYLDTGERKVSAMWATYKECETCANEPSGVSFPATPPSVKPNLAFLAAQAEADTLDIQRAVRAELERRADLEAAAAGAPTTADKLLALCPVSLMDAACELDVPYKSIRGHALTLQRAGRARMLRGKLVRVNP
jgi:hypothetical protein